MSKEVDDSLDKIVHSLKEINEEIESLIKIVKSNPYHNPEWALEPLAYEESVKKLHKMSKFMNQFSKEINGIYAKTLQVASRKDAKIMDKIEAELTDRLFCNCKECNPTGEDLSKYKNLLASFKAQA